MNNHNLDTENGHHATQKALIIVVDDEMPILTSLRSLFRRVPYTVEYFSSAQNALDYLIHHTPDIIISDMRMPEMNGSVFLERAAVLCPSSSRIILSGYEDKNLILETLSRTVAHQFIMKPWEDKELLSRLTQILQLRLEVQQQNLDILMQSLALLPTPPQLIEQLQHIIHQKTRSSKELGDELQKDPASVARILRIANSVYYASRMPITDLVEAISFIGTEYIESIILAMHAFDNFPQQHEEEYIHFLDDLWRHSLHRAYIGKTLAEQWQPVQSSSLAYIVCLLSDIGYILRLSMDFEKYKKMHALALSLQIPIDEAEQKVFDITHTEIGYVLLRLWNFPNKIIDAIRFHQGETEHNPLARIAQIAHYLESGNPCPSYNHDLIHEIQKWQKIILPESSSGT